MALLTRSCSLAGKKETLGAEAGGIGCDLAAKY